MQRLQYFLQHFYNYAKYQVVTTCYWWQQNNYSDIFKEKKKMQLQT